MITTCCGVESGPPASFTEREATSSCEVCPPSCSRSTTTRETLHERDSSLSSCNASSAGSLFPVGHILESRLNRFAVRKPPSSCSSALCPGFAQLGVTEALYCFLKCCCHPNFFRIHHLDLVANQLQAQVRRFGVQKSLIYFFGAQDSHKTSVAPHPPRGHQRCHDAAEKWAELPSAQILQIKNPQRISRDPRAAEKEDALWLNLRRPRSGKPSYWYPRPGNQTWRKDLWPSANEDGSASRYRR